MEEQAGQMHTMDDADRTRLVSFEKMLKAVREEYEDIERQMEKLKKSGRTKSATYRQLMGRKMTCQNIISMYKIYDLL